MVLWLVRFHGRYHLHRRYYELGDGSMSYMMQTESFKALQHILGELSKASNLLELVRVKEIYLSQEPQGLVWNVCVDREVFDVLSGDNMRIIHEADNEDDIVIIRRVALNTPESINLFTISDLRELGE